MSVCLIACSRQPSRTVTPHEFDSLVSKELMSSFARDPMKATFSIADTYEGHQYLLLFDLARATDDIFTLSRIVVMPGGSRLSTEAIAEYKKKISEFEGRSGKKVFSDLISSYPKVGSQSLPVFFASPNGGGWGIVFTTSDGRFDISVTEDSHLYLDMKSPGMDIVGLAKAISEKYDQRVQKKYAEQSAP